jgi:predicted nucleic acid-binding protein
MIYYLDTSAFLKLVYDEPESLELRGFLDGLSEDVGVVSNWLLATEAKRSAKRTGTPVVIVTSQLDNIDLFPMSRSTYEKAGDIENYGTKPLRSLDALHLASAVEAGSKFFVTYDNALIDTAKALGLEAISPGAEQLGRV